MALGTGRMKIRHWDGPYPQRVKLAHPSDDERFTKDHISSVNQASYHIGIMTESHVSRKVLTKGI